MNKTPPKFTLCIPTFNRAKLLDYCLQNLRQFLEYGVPFEIVISDNNSSDSTAEVVKRHQEHLSIKHCVHASSIYYGAVNATRNASGDYVAYLADDDSIAPEVFMSYLQELDKRPELSAIFTDWMAWNDETGTEMHRYFPDLGKGKNEFGAENSVDLVNFILQQRIFPEVAIIRRRDVLKAECCGRRYQYNGMRWAYQLSRCGKVAFRTEPYYREHRVIKPHLMRAATANVAGSLNVIGDEFRLELETILLWAMQDAGLDRVPPAQAASAKNLIDDFLNARLELEVTRAIHNKDWLLALDLRRRHVLWYGPGDKAARQRDLYEISLPACLQTVRDACQNLCDVRQLALVGFKSRFVADFFKAHYPDIALSIVDALAEAPASQAVILAKAGDSSDNGYHYSLPGLLRLYSVTPLDIDLDSL